jgi:hypothetical protein
VLIVIRVSPGESTLHADLVPVKEIPFVREWSLRERQHKDFARMAVAVALAS